jgi:hypothetical protein
MTTIRRKNECTQVQKAGKMRRKKSKKIEKYFSFSFEKRGTVHPTRATMAKNNLAI